MFSVYGSKFYYWPNEEGDLTMTELLQDLPTCDPTSLEPYMDLFFNSGMAMGFLLGFFVLLILDILGLRIIDYLKPILDKKRKEKGI